MTMKYVTYYESVEFIAQSIMTGSGSVCITNGSQGSKSFHVDIEALLAQNCVTILWYVGHGLHMHMQYYTKNCKLQK